MAEIGNVTVRVDAVITDEQYREAMGAVRAANERMDLLQAENAKMWDLAHLVAEYVSADQCKGCLTKRACNAGELDMCWIRKAILGKLRELGVEVEV